MRLAEACGRKDWRAMLDEMTPEEFDEWRAKDIVDPIGSRGVYEILAFIGALLANTFGAKDVTPESFMYWRKESKPEKVKESQDAAMLLLETAMRAKRG